MLQCLSLSSLNATQSEQVQELTLSLGSSESLSSLDSPGFASAILGCTLALPVMIVRFKGRQVGGQVSCGYREETCVG